MIIAVVHLCPDRLLSGLLAGVGADIEHFVGQQAVIAFDLCSRTLRVRRHGLECGIRVRMPVIRDQDSGVRMSKLSPSSGLVLGCALVMAGGLLVPFALLQAPDFVHETSLVLGAILLALIVLLALARGILRSRRPGAAARRGTRSTRAWVWLNAMVLVGAVAVLGANQFSFVSLGHDGADRACARADVSPYHADPTVGSEGEWTFLPPTLVCHYASDDGDPRKNVTADLFPTGAGTFWLGLSALACGITAGLLFRSTRKADKSAPVDLQRDAAAL